MDSTQEDSTPQAARLALWMPQREEQLWESCVDLAPKQILILVGFWVLVHTAVHTMVKHRTKNSSLNNPQKLIFTQNVVGVLHSAFCAICGYFVLFRSPWETFNQPGRLFAFSYVHDSVSSVSLGYWTAGSLFAVANAASVGIDTVGKVLLQTVALYVLTYVNWVFPSTLGIKLWQWWNVAAVGIIPLSLSRLSLMTDTKPKNMIKMFVVGLVCSIAVMWGSGMLAIWAYWQCTKDDLGQLPSTHPVHHWAKWHLPSMVGCSSCWTLVSYFEFQHIVALIKTWSDNVKDARRLAAQRSGGEEHEADRAGEKTE